MGTLLDTRAFYESSSEFTQFVGFFEPFDTEKVKKEYSLESATLDELIKLAETGSPEIVEVHLDYK